MKIKNIFKKAEKTFVKANVQKLEKNQLEKVVGGVDELPLDGETSNTSRVGKTKFKNITMN